MRKDSPFSHVKPLTGKAKAAVPSVFLALLFFVAACAAPTAVAADPPMPSASPSPEPVVVEISAVPESSPDPCTPTPEPTPTPTPTPTPEPTEEPTPSPKPTKTPRAKKTEAAQITPDPDATPKPAFYLNHSETEIYGGGVCQLVSYCYSDDNECATTTWKSSDKSVAMIDEYGVVVGLKKGTATITAKANDGTKNRAVCQIRVTSDRPQPNRKINIKNCLYSGTKLTRENADDLQKYIDSLDETRHTGEAIVLSALRYTGRYYGTKEGNIDCSMLLFYTGLDNRITLPRRSDWQAEALKKYEVKYTELKPGDFMFFAYKPGIVCTCSTAPHCKRYLGIHHAAVYLGKVDGVNYIVEASSKVGRVCVREWDGNSDHAGMDIVFCGRPGKLK